jgi:hypothetical protein
MLPVNAEEKTSDAGIFDGRLDLSRRGTAISHLSPPRERVPSGARRVRGDG